MHCPHGKQAGQAQVLDHPDLLLVRGPGVPGTEKQAVDLWAAENDVG